MILKQLSETAWKLYQDGKPKANDQKLTKADINQMVMTSAANNFRQQYLTSQVMVNGRKVSFSNADSEYSFLSPLLSIKRFSLGETNAVGMRRIDMSNFDLYRLPKNFHFSNIYPVNNECDGKQVGNITLVQNGEEKFYQSAEFSGYLFAAVVGRGLNIYHLPPCVKSVDVETTYNSDDADISMDVCYDVLNEVLGLIFRIGEANEEFQLKVKKALQQMEDIK